MKRSILFNWNLVRFRRLGIGIAILVQAVTAKDILFAIAGLLFTGMAVFNVGCCGMGGCTIPNTITKKTTDVTKDITYEEVV